MNPYKQNTGDIFPLHGAFVVDSIACGVKVLHKVFL